MENEYYFGLQCTGSFAGLGFLAWYLCGKIKVFNGEGYAAKLCIVVLPYLAAALVGISRVDDYWHHWTDVFAGALIGYFSKFMQLYLRLYFRREMFFFLSIFIFV